MVITVCHKISIKVNSEITASEEIFFWFKQLNSPSITDKVMWWHCETLLHEGFANIVEHAHKDLPPQTPIALEAKRCEKYIEICIWFYGPIFNLEKKLKEIPPLEDNESEGGRGLRIMDELADWLSYDRVGDNLNCLRMKKYFPKKETGDRRQNET